MSLEDAEAILRPTAATLQEEWRTIVRSEREQVESLPQWPRPADFYAPVAQNFVAEPARQDDIVVNALLDLVRPDETWLDLGAGAGRYALPIARKAAMVFAVEPSAGMRGALDETVRAAGIANVAVFDERWPGESKVPVADCGLISQVGYDIEDIGAFLEALESHVRRLCVAVLFERSPTSDFAPLWQPVHGEARVVLPGLRELVTLLFALGRLPEVRLLSLPGRVYPDLTAMQQSVRRAIWVIEGSAEDARLSTALEPLATRDGDAWRLGPKERRLGIVTWAPRDRGGDKA